MVGAFVGFVRDLFRGNRGFIALAAMGFAACFLLSELGRAHHWRWLTGWPPVLFVFTVPPEYRFRYTNKAWVWPVFSAMTLVTITGLAIASMIERLVERQHLAAPPTVASDVVRLLPVVVIGGLLFGALSMFSAWGLYSLFYRPDGRAPRALKRPRK
jgi:cytochrome b subunit of formate dehydrogenase